ncbi:MAG TPA: hypothetical protein VF077_13145 [Nitrospiraceae bacterium]
MTESELAQFQKNVLHVSFLERCGRMFELARGELGSAIDVTKSISQREARVPFDDRVKKAKGLIAEAEQCWEEALKCLD